jgi:hypothetical protein
MYENILKGTTHRYEHVTVRITYIGSTGKK